MTHEEQAPRQEDQPDDEHEQIGYADAYMADLVKDTSPAVARVVAAAYAEHGTAFALYLALYGADKYFGGGETDATADDPAELIEADFKNTYYSHFPDRETIVDDTIASFDWGIELDRVLLGHAELKAMVAFDRDAVWTFANRYYEIVDGADGLYLFERWHN